MKGIFFAAMLVASVAQAQPPTAHVVNSPNTLGWPASTHISRLEVTDKGVRPVFDKCEAWPDVTPPGWQGPLRFTLHLFLNIGGEWWESGIIQFWACDQYNGGPIYQDNQIARNWVYDNRWGSMVGHQPAPGELIGFMVSAGNARGQDDHVVAERSGIVGINMPTSPQTFQAPWAYDEGASAPPVPPAPQPVPLPVPLPVPVPTDPTLAAQLQFYQSITNARFDAIDKTLASFREDEETHWTNAKNAFYSVVKSPVFQTIVTSLSTFLITRQAVK